MNDNLEYIKDITGKLGFPDDNSGAGYLTLFFKTFHGEISSFCEFGLDPGKKRLGLLIQGQSAGFIKRMKNFIHAIDLHIPPGFYKMLITSYSDTGILFKLDLFSSKPPAASVYLRKELQWTEFNALVESAEARCFEDIFSGALNAMRRSGAFPFIDMEAGEHPVSGAVISANLGEGELLLSSHLLDIFSMLPWDVPEDTLEWNRVLIEEYNREIFCSLELSCPDIKRLKLDYPGVRIEVGRELLSLWGTKKKHIKLLDDKINMFSRDRLDYFGMILSPGSMPRGKLYLQVKGNNASIENLINELQYKRFRSILG
ncbi:MAG: hypothetical protein M1269_08010 [Chloroflexi bacterium]|nr:hypothetical protein [Chloroflexota bacterium]